MKTIYIAYDGEEFDTEEECMEYEKKIDYFCIDCSNHIYCEDVNSEPIDLAHTPFNIDQAFRVYIFSEHGVELARKLHDYYGVCMPTSTGAFEYDGNTDTYISINKQIPSLEILLNEYKEFRNKAMNYYENSTTEDNDFITVSDVHRMLGLPMTEDPADRVTGWSIDKNKVKGDDENDSTNSNN